MTALAITKQLFETPMRVAEHWPWLIALTGMNMLSDVVVGEPTIDFDPRVDSFSDPAILRNLAYQSLIQGTQDVINNVVWGNGYSTVPPSGTVSVTSNPPAINAYY